MRGANRAKTARARQLRRAQTDTEGRLWARLSNRQLAGHKFVRQEPIGPYFADFACRDAKLVVELDGDQHADSARDAVRDAYLRRASYRVIRFWNGEVRTNLDGVLQTILLALGEREPAPHPDPLPARGERE
jgi:very-short-patch-repair endonuclease